LLRRISLHDKARLEVFLGRDRVRHLFELGDLDPAYWPYTAWYGLVDDDRLKQIALVYFGRPGPPILMLYGDEPVEEARALFSDLVPILPARLYAHLGAPLLDVARDTCDVEDHGLHVKMHLADAASLPRGRHHRIEPLSPSDAAGLSALYGAADRQLRCIRVEGAMTSVAGVYVCSPTYGVAALGGIATHPDFRRHGFAREVTAAVCRDLLSEGIRTLGLVVEANNAAAIALYESVGFVKDHTFHACTLTAHAARP
jgi:ribosomal protein S18 acetylase RimI-like enzyme